MKILLLGSGGREHAITWKLAKSSQLEKLYIAPGNAGTRELGVNVNLDLNDFNQIKEFVLEKQINLLVVGPEGPLVNGIHDFFLTDKDIKHIGVIGPTKAGAMLEGSKDFAKKFMKRHNIPTAKYLTVTKENLNDGFKFLDTLHSPYVLKADGLAAGKGVLIIKNLNTAKIELESILYDNKFGNAGTKVVIEEFLDGIEMSSFIITDGESYKILPEAKDYKRIGEKDTGLNTGGMGSVSPVPFANSEFLDKVENQIIIPTIKGLKKEKINYKGFIFFGIIKVKGDPYVIEYNCRMGDPETEVVMPRLKSDLLDILEGVVTNTLSERDVYFDDRTAVSVMMVSGGYPQEYEKGKVIYGIPTIEDSILFHAGTSGDGPEITTNGGRVLALTSYGRDIKSARKKAYADIEKINFENAYYRNDIGIDLM